MKWMHILKDTYNQAHSKEKKKNPENLNSSILIKNK